MQWRFPHHQNQPPPLFQRDVGRAGQQRLVTPVAISDIDRIEHGATIIPVVRKPPLAMAEAMSSISCVVCAAALTSAIFTVVS